MRETAKRAERTAGILFLVLLVAGATWLTKPWDDLQSWRWFTMPFEGLRADVFTNWRVIQLEFAAVIRTLAGREVFQ